jgi:hypothetical protein
MNLAATIFANADRFYDQKWYWGEAFMDRTPAPYMKPPSEFRAMRNPGQAKFLPYAATLAKLWLDYPHLDIWQHYIWTGDFDRDGQQVYVGVNNGKFEIHRHLHLTDRWGALIW